MNLMIHRYGIQILIGTLLFFALSAPAHAEYYTWDGNQSVRVEGNEDSVQADWGYTFISSDTGREWFVGGYTSADKATKALKYWRDLELSLNRYFHTQDHAYASGHAPVAHQNSLPLGPVGATLVRSKVAQWKSKILPSALTLVDLPALNGLNRAGSLQQMAKDLVSATQIGTRGDAALSVLDELGVKTPDFIKAVRNAQRTESRLEGLLNADPTIPNLAADIAQFQQQMQDDMRNLDQAYERTPRLYKDFQWAMGSTSWGSAAWLPAPVGGRVEMWTRDSSLAGNYGSKYTFWRARNTSSQSVKLHYKITKGITVVEEGSFRLDADDESPIFWGENGSSIKFTQE